MVTVDKLLARAIILPIRSAGIVIPVAVLVRWLALAWRWPLTSMRTSMWWRVVRQLIRQWVAFELFYLVYYHWTRWRLKRKRLVVPSVRGPPGTKQRLLRRVIETLDMIGHGEALRRSIRGLPRWELSPALRRKHEAGVWLNIEDAFCEEATPGSCRVDEATWRAARPEVVGTCEQDASTLALSSPEGGSQGRRAPAVVPAITTATPTAAQDRPLVSSRVLVRDHGLDVVYRHSEFRGLFRGTPLKDIGLENVKEYLAWAFWGSPLAGIRAGAPQQELQAMAEMLSTECMFDDLQSRYRPLTYYAVTSTGIDLALYAAMRYLGFRSYSAGTMRYWFRPSSTRGSGSRQGSPIVFAHGLGIGVLPYIALLRKLLRATDYAVPIFAVEMPHIAMHIKSAVPSAAEMVTCVREMLEAWRDDAGALESTGAGTGCRPGAHFVGHSFGTVLIAWVIRRAPDLVAAVTMIDPIPFLLNKPDLCHNFLYRQPANGHEELIRYFCGRELFTSHTLQRHLVWHESILFAEDLNDIPANVVLSGRDGILPAHSVHRYLLCAKYLDLTGGGADESGGDTDTRHVPHLTGLRLFMYEDKFHAQFMMPGERMADDIVAAITSTK